MTEVRARLARGRALDVGDFADLTDVPASRVGWGDDGRLEVEFAGEIPPEVAAAVERRIVSRDEAEEALRAEAADYLLVTAPTEVQRNEQIDRLTRITLNGPSE